MFVAVVDVVGIGVVVVDVVFGVVVGVVGVVGVVVVDVFVVVGVNLGVDVLSWLLSRFSTTIASTSIRDVLAKSRAFFPFGRGHCTLIFPVEYISMCDPG